MSWDELEESSTNWPRCHYDELGHTLPSSRWELENSRRWKVVDTHWMEHLDAMDALREVDWPGHGQRDPPENTTSAFSDMSEAMKEAALWMMYPAHVLGERSD